VYHVLLYDVVDDYLTRRVPLREAHLRLVREAHGRGELALAGAYGDPVVGALLVFHSSEPAVVERFVASDPYVREGLVTRWRVLPWHEVLTED
jgi:uncharacterized protein YciI